MKPKRERWQLDRSEVSVAMRAYASGDRHRTARESRKLDERGVTLHLEHRPTGVSVEASVPGGHYSRDELRTLKEQLSLRLFRELEAKVARHLRLPGF